MGEQEHQLFKRRGRKENSTVDWPEAKMGKTPKYRGGEETGRPRHGTDLMQAEPNGLQVLFRREGCLLQTDGQGGYGEVETLLKNKHR